MSRVEVKAFAVVGATQTIYTIDGKVLTGVGAIVPLSDLSDYARGSIIRGGAADWEAYAAKTDGALLVGDGTDIVSTVNPTLTGTLTLPNTGLHLLDTNASHDLIIAPGSDLTADRTLTLTTGDAARTITLSGNPTLADWFDQSVKVAASPTVVGLTLSGLTASTVIYSNAAKAITSLANATGYLYNDGAGALSYDAMPAPGAHVVNSTGPHAEAGLTVGHVLRVSGAAAFSFAAIQVGDLPAHNILSASHGDTLAAGVSRGSIIYGNATPAWAELVHPGAAYHLQTDANDVVWSQDITMAADATVDGLDLSILGDALFTKDAGLLLLGPGCKITDDKWTSTRGQVATIAGAFHQEAGPWAESRGLVVEEAGLNYEPAPRMIDGDSGGLADGWSYWDNFGSGGSATQTVVPHPVAERGWLQRLQYTAAAGDVNDYCIIYDDTAVGSFAQGDDVTVSIDAKGIVTGCVFRIIVQERDAASVLGTTHTGSSISLTHGIERFEYTFTTVDADCSLLRIRISVRSVDNGDSFDVYFGAVNCEKADYATSFMHGDLDWCAWSAGADTGTTTRATTTVNLDAHTSLVSDEDTLTFSMWAQMPYDYDATWPTGYLMDVRGANDNNRFIIQYHSPSKEFQVYLNGAWRITNGATQTFKAGDWIFVAVTLDYANDEYYSYVGGALDGNSTASLTAPTGLTDWQIGARYNGVANWSNGTFAEFAVLDTVLTANEIAAHYASGKPLADAGAMTVPHADFISATFRGRSGAQVELARDNIPIYGTILDDETAAMTDVAILEHQSRETVAADFGAGALFRLEDAGGTVRDALRLGVVWQSAAAAENAEFQLWLNYDGTLRQCGVVVGSSFVSVDGNQRGGAAVDWQIIRTNATEVASGNYAALIGGRENTASGTGAAVLAGAYNVASGLYAVAFGQSCTSQGQASVACGYRAKTGANNGTFVFADVTAADFTANRADQFKIRCNGGAYWAINNSDWIEFYHQAAHATNVIIDTSDGAYLTAAGVWTDASSRRYKENFSPAWNDVLDKVARLPVNVWNYKTEPGMLRCGPVAEDFHDIFGLGTDDGIAGTDAAGVALAAIQALLKRIDVLESLLVV